MSVLPETSWFETFDGTKLFQRKWRTENPPRAVVHIIHGMSEHGGRYGNFAEFLTARGIEVRAADMRGHGKTADLSVNSPEYGGLMGHCADRNANRKLLCDIGRLNEDIKKTRPDLPLFLLGHSWGSFLAQAYIESSKTKLAGCILSGTRGTAGADLHFGIILIKMFCLAKGIRARSKFISMLFFGAYNKSFKPARTLFDWMSRDQKAVDEFTDDYLCGKAPTIGFFYDLAALLIHIQNRKNINKISRELPIYIFSGSSDPVGLFGDSVISLFYKYKNRQIRDLEFILYPQARHECLNEINKKEVYHNLAEWLLNRI